jgi:ribosomal protein L16/L10AE
MRMGTGKGKFRYYVTKYYKGDIFLEFNLNSCRSKHTQIKFLKALYCKLPGHIKIVKCYS